MSASERPAVTPERIMQMSWGYSAPLMLEAGVRNGVFDALDNGPKTVDELVRQTGASARGLRTLLNGLVGTGILTKNSDRYALAPDAAAFLVQGKPGYLGGLISLGSGKIIPPWLKLTEIVQKGGPDGGVNTEHVGTPFFQELVNAIFPLSYGPAQVLARGLKLAESGKNVRVLDLGAGSGVWGIALAESSPRVKVTAFDWPAVLEVTRKNVASHGVQDQFDFAAGDLGSADFGSEYDVAVLGHILHSEGEQRSRALLRKIFASLVPGGILAIQEFLVEPDHSGPPMALIFAVNMLVNTDQGDTWSFQEIAGWLREAGFENIRPLDAPGPSPLILANRPS